MTFETTCWPRSRRKVPTVSVATKPEPPQEASRPEPRLKEPLVAAPPPKPKRWNGKQIQFWFREQGGRLVRELAAWLAGQGVQPTDSLVIRAALRTAQVGGALLQAYRKAAELDGRLKNHKPKSD